MDYKISDYYISHGFKPKDIEKAKLFELILSGSETSRKKLNQRLHLRPNNVSEAIQQLLDDNLISEIGTPRTEGRGRPEVMIRPNIERFVAITIWILAGSLSSALTDINGNLLWRQTEPIPKDCDNTQFLNAVIKAVTDIQYGISKKQTLIGIGIAVPGGISSNGMKWIFNSRLGCIRNLDFSNLSSHFGVPVKLFRLLDSQLKALNTQNSSFPASSVLLVHWGYGVGASFSIKGDIPSSLTGSIAEVGHMKVDRTPRAILCSCGEYGCLETFSSGKVLEPEIERIVGFSPSEDDDELGEVLADCDFSNNEPFKVAVEKLTDVLDTTFRMIFPDKIIIYGPFVRNLGIRRKLIDSLRGKIPEYARSSVDIEIMEGSLESLVTIGCTFDFFREKLMDMLVFYGNDIY